MNKKSNTESQIVEKEAFGSYDVTSSPVKFDISSCRICLSSLFDPARLACGHKFCERCLDKYWKATEEPSFVVCPLCRTYAFKVGFVEKDEVESTWDLRKQFDPSTIEKYGHGTQTSKQPGSKLCLKFSMVMTLIFFLVRYLKHFIRNFLMLVSLFEV